MAEIFVEQFEITGELIRSEDGGRALIVESDSDIPGDDNMFVRLQSWDDLAKHTLMRSLIGKTVRVTVEVLD